MQGIHKLYMLLRMAQQVFSVNNRNRFDILEVPKAWKKKKKFISTSWNVAF